MEGTVQIREIFHAKELASWGRQPFARKWAISTKLQCHEKPIGESHRLWKLDSEKTAQADGAAAAG